MAALSSPSLDRAACERIQPTLRDAASALTGSDEVPCTGPKGHNRSL